MEFWHQKTSRSDKHRADSNVRTICSLEDTFSDREIPVRNQFSDELSRYISMRMRYESPFSLNLTLLIPLVQASLSTQGHLFRFGAAYSGRLKALRIFSTARFSIRDT